MAPKVPIKAALVIEETVDVVTVEIIIHRGAGFNIPHLKNPEKRTRIRLLYGKPYLLARNGGIRHFHLLTFVPDFARKSAVFHRLERCFLTIYSQGLSDRSQIPQG
jgi:hypothetical protein